MSSTLTSNERVFQSLNCAKCRKPFLANTFRAPQAVWFSKYLYLCCECFEYEKLRTKEERWKPIEDEEFSNVSTVKFLLELIADDSLQINESKTGYIIAKEPFAAPECSVCLEAYEIDDPIKFPFDLYCHHTICIGCYRRMRTDKKPINPEYSSFVFQIACPICQRITGTDLTDIQENALKDFLEEIPEMVEQYKATKALRATQRNTECSTCPKKAQINKMHYCVDCKVEVCVHCAFDMHRLHNVIKLAKERVKAIVEEIDQVTANQVETYEKMFDHLQSELVKTISELKLKFKELTSRVTEMENYDEAIEKTVEFRQLGKRFEEISEKFVPSFRSCHTEMKTLLEQLNK